MAEDQLTTRSELERYFPDRQQRRALLGIVADTIDKITQIAPAAWSLSLRPYPANVFRLTAGPAEVLWANTDGTVCFLVEPSGAAHVHLDGSNFDEPPAHRSVPTAGTLSV